MIDILIFILATMIDLKLKDPFATTNDCTYTMLLRRYDRTTRDQPHSSKIDTYMPGVPKTVRGPPITLKLRHNSENIEPGGDKYV